MKTSKKGTGHLFASISVLIWGVTFISTKILLDDFTPVEILFYRFVIGFIILFLIFPHRLRGTNIKQELMFAAAGLCGVMLYFLCENIALTYTLASNVGVIVSIAPFFTALFSHWLLGDEKLKANFLLGFIIALAGIVLINFNGSMILKLNPIGDLLAVSAAIVWAVYSILVKKISTYGCNSIQMTRRIFFYALILMLPILFLLPFEWDINKFLKTVNIVNIIFLGMGASALCYVTWNTAVRLLGAVKTSIYIYMIPAIAVVTAWLILNEQITIFAVCGAILTMAGLFISERK